MIDLNFIFHEVIGKSMGGGGVNFLRAFLVNVRDYDRSCDESQFYDRKKKSIFFSSDHRKMIDYRISIAITMVNLWHAAFRMTHN